jgi:hypothetical protein
LKPIIEPLIIPQKQLDELKVIMTDPKLPDMTKTNFLRQVTGGACHSCGSIPDKLVKYHRSGITVIEKYCNNCLTRMKL